MNDQACNSLPLETLGPYLERHVPTFRGLCAAEKFRGGQSNPTYRLAANSGLYVLRHQPFGILLPSAHAVDREYRVIQALGGTGIPVAKALHLCEDRSVLGSMFYVMSYVPGTIYWDPALPEITQEKRGLIFDEMNRVLAQLHDVEIEAVGLEDFGRPGDYFVRQVSRWSRQYRASETETLGDMNALIRWLPENIPPDNGMVSLIHGDYRIDNLIFDPGLGTVRAILDWELSTLGHPYADLAYQCMHWHLSREEVMPGLGDLEREEWGIPTEQEYVARYCKRRGIAEIPHWPFYLAFSFFRFAAIMQGVYRRSLEGNASNERAALYGSLVKPLAQLGITQTS